MLQPFIRKELIDIWDDTLIRPGTNWATGIESSLATAKVAVLLVSPDFLASDFINTHELPKLLARAREKRLTVLWLLVRPCLHELSDFVEFQALSDPATPLASYERNKVRIEVELKKVAMRIRASLDQIRCSD